MTVTDKTPRAFMQIPDVNGDGIRDFVISHLDSGWGIGNDVNAYVYPGTVNTITGAVTVTSPYLTNKRAATVTEDYVYQVPYTDPESGKPAVHETHGRVLSLTVADQKGVDHSVQVFVPDHMYNAAAKPDAPSIQVNVPEWGPMVVLGQ